MIPIRISSNAAAVAEKLQAFPEAMLRGVASALDEQNELTVGEIQEKRMSRRGPQTLGVVTNRARSSVRPARAQVQGRRVLSAIGSNVIYFGVHEYGFDGNVTVRSYTRRRFEVKQADSTFDAKTGKIRKGRRRKIEKASVTVRSHPRHMQMPARAPIRRTIEERVPQYSSAISEAIVAAWKGGRG